MDIETQDLGAGRESWLASSLGLVTRGLLNAPRLVLAVSMVLAVAAVVFAAAKMGFRGSRLDLLDPDSNYNRRWLAYLAEFGSDDDVVIVVDGSSTAQVTAAIDDIVSELIADPERFHSVLFQQDLTALRGKALFFLSSAELRDIEELTKSSQLFTGDSRSLSVQGVAQSIENVLAASRQVGGPSVDADWLRAYLSGLQAALLAEAKPASPWATTLERLRDLSTRFEPKYLLHDDGQLGLVLLRLAHGPDSTTAASVRHLRKALANLRDRHPQTRIGVTGMPILESDEMQASQRDTASASVVSLAGVALVFMLGFGGFRRPLFSLTALIMALAWSLAYITLSVGHLNILSAAFGVILIGLGVDFSIHYLSQYASSCQGSADRMNALVTTARSVGPGIVTGGVTTSLAFSTAALAPFLGIAELGVIVAGGILLCLAATILVLPALIIIWDRPGQLWLQPTEIAHWFEPIQRHPRITVTIGLVSSMLVGFGALRLEYDHNLLNLQPDELESVTLERRLSTRLNRGVWHALSASADRQQLLARKARFEQLPSVAATEEILSVVPMASVLQRLQIDQIRDNLVDLPGEAPFVPLDDPDEVAATVSRLTRLLGEQRDVGGLFGQQIAALSEATFYDRLSTYQQRMASDLLEALRLVRSISTPIPPGISDLPAALRQRFVGKNGVYLLRVYGRGDIWDIEPLERFVKGIESVDPGVTGHPVQTYYASREMLRSFLNAAIYSVLAVSIVLMLDFRQIHLCLLAMFPMAFGMLLMFGTLGWLAIPLNPANMIVLPLILGIGIDDGVHVVHDFLRQPCGRYRLSSATARAVLLTSATTMIGFGSMMLASHRGLRSLGQVLTIGIFCCLLTSLFLLPPLLGWIGGAFSSEE